MNWTEDDDEPPPFPVGDVWVDPDSGWVKFPNGQRACLHIDRQQLMLPESAIERRPLSEVAEALCELAEHVATSEDWPDLWWYLALQEDPHEVSHPQLRPGVVVCPLHHALVDVVVEVDGLRPRQDEAFEQGMGDLLAPLLARWDGQMDRVLRSEPWEGSVSVRLRLPTRDRTGSDLVRFAEEARALLRAARNGPLQLQTARDLIVARCAGALVGLREGTWLDVKRAPYRLDSDTQKFELARDASAFANAAGGLLLIPATTRKERNGEVIDEVRDMALDLVDADQIRDVLADWVYPAIDGLEVLVVEVAPARGHLMIHVPPQPAGLWPHVVARAPMGGRILSTAVAICVRHDADIRSLSPARVHTLLQAGRRQVLDREDPRLSAPDVVAQLSGHKNEVGGRGRVLVHVTVANKGQTIARDVSCGLRYEGADQRYTGAEFVADKDDGLGELVIPALGLGEHVRATVALDQGDMTPLRAYQERIGDVLGPWVRFSDKRGNRYRWPPEHPS